MTRRRHVWLAVRLSLLALAAAGAARAGSEEDRGFRLLDRSLRSGVRVGIKGAFDADGRFVASEIEVRREADEDEELRGRIESVDPGARSFRLLGQTVELRQEARLQFEPDGAATLADLAPGTRVKVDGRTEAAGRFVAEKVRIRENQSYDERRVVGPIREVLRSPDGLAVLRVVGLEIHLTAATDLTDPRGRERPIVRGRLGPVDDDDLQLVRTGRPGARLATAGEVRVRTTLVSDPDLDPATDDDELVPELFGIFGMAVDLGSAFVYAEIQGERELVLEGEERFERGESDLRLAELYVEIPRVLAPWMSIVVGRQKFYERRQWHYSTKDLDAVRLLADLHPFRFEASWSQNLFNESRNVASQETRNLILQASYEVRRELWLEGYWIDRRDDGPVPESPRILGLRLIGEPTRRVELWADLARETGRRGTVESPGAPLVVREVRARAADLGMTWRPRVRWDPSFTASYAMGSGGDESAAVDRTFRQSGLQRNRWKYNGVVSFRYYGEVLDPELSNLHIATLRAGLRPRRSFSIDLLYHRYRQDRPSAELFETDLDEDPQGLRDEVGDEWDVALGFEPSRRFELRLTAGRFRPGAAFAADASASTVARFQAKFRF